MGSKLLQLQMNLQWSQYKFQLKKIHQDLYRSWSLYINIFLLPLWITFIFKLTFHKFIYVWNCCFSSTSSSLLSCLYFQVSPLYPPHPLFAFFFFLGCSSLSPFPLYPGRLLTLIWFSIALILYCWFWLFFILCLHFYFLWTVFIQVIFHPSFNQLLSHFNILFSYLCSFASYSPHFPHF